MRKNPINIDKGRGACSGVALRLCLVLLTSQTVWWTGVGCNRPLKPIFEPLPNARAWPPAPAQARIRYVGQLSRDTDLKPPRRTFQAIADFFVGKAPANALYGPRAVLRTADGERIWVADPGGRCVHLFDLNSRRYERIQRAGELYLTTPVGLAPGPEGSFFVCDSEGVGLYRLNDRTGALIDVVRMPEDVRRPVAVHYDAADGGTLLVVDAAAHDIKELNMDGTLRRLIGRRGSGPGEFNFPCDITADGDMIWVADAGNQRVQGLSRDGAPMITIGQVGDAPGDLALPKSVAVDSDGHVYVVDARFENVQVFDRAGRLLLFFGEEGVGPGQFWLPSNIFIDASDRIWVSDSYNRRVQVFDYVKGAGDDGEQ